MTIGEMRDELLKGMQKGNSDYRSGYVDGVLDMFNAVSEEKRNADEIAGSERVPLGASSGNC